MLMSRKTLSSPSPFPMFIAMIGYPGSEDYGP
jgi:hypothetical protein